MYLCKNYRYNSFLPVPLPRHQGKSLQSLCLHFLFETGKNRSLGWGKHFDLLMEFLGFVLEMGLQDQTGAKTVAIVVHLFVVGAAKSHFICFRTHIIFHIRGSGPENKVHSVLLQLPLHKAEGAFVIRLEGVH